MKKKVKKNKTGIVVVFLVIIFLGWLITKIPVSENISGGKGYTDVFQAKDGKRYTQYIQGADALWAEHNYWGGSMRENGCGITAIAIIASGYGKEDTPEILRKKYAPHLEGNKMAKVLEEDFGIANSGFCYSQKEFSSKRIKESLEKGQPVLICVTNQPDSKWTKKSHYMVLLDVDGEKVYVCNPSAGDNGNKHSGWYPIKEVQPYIVKAVYVRE